jgi:hypothetical protein
MEEGDGKGDQAREVPPPLILPHKRLCHNQRKTTSVARRDRRSGEEALDLPAQSPALRDQGRAETFNDQLLTYKPLKRQHLKRERLPITLNDRILKLRGLTVCPSQIFPLS